jgi:hypothetical protein
MTDPRTRNMPSIDPFSAATSASRLGDTVGGGEVDKGVEEPRPDPAAPSPGHHHGELPVAVREQAITGLGDNPALAPSSQGDHEASVAPGGVGEIVEEPCSWPIGPEEPSMAVVGVELVVEVEQVALVFGAYDSQREVSPVGQGDITLHGTGDDPAVVIAS